MTYVMPHFDYADILYDTLLTSADCQRLEKMQYRASRLVTSTLPSTSYAKLREDLGWLSLKERREIHKIQFFHRLYHGTTPEYIRQVLPPTRGSETNVRLRNARLRNEVNFRISHFQQSYLPSAVKLVNKIPLRVMEINSHKLFRKRLAELIDNRQINMYHSLGPKHLNSLLTQLRVGRSKLNSHAFSIQKSDTPFCDCGYRREDTHHFFLKCPKYAIQRTTLIRGLSDNLGAGFAILPEKEKLKIILHGQGSNEETHCAVAREVFKFLQTSKRFSVTDTGT